MLKNFNIWLISSLLVSIGVLIPITTVFFSFFEETSNYYEILKETFLLEYIFNSFTLLVSVLMLTFILIIGFDYTCTGSVTFITRTGSVAFIFFKSTFKSNDFIEASSISGCLTFSIVVWS